VGQESCFLPVKVKLKVKN